MIQLTSLPIWEKLRDHQQQLSAEKMSDWFVKDHNRFQKFSLAAADLFLDYSKNFIQESTLKLLYELAEQCQLKKCIENLLSGKIVNLSENRPALHSALRSSKTNTLLVDGANVMPWIQGALKKMYQIAEAIRKRNYLGFNQQPIDTILHFGIGGSDLGPLMVFEALEEYIDPSLRYQFFSYQDPDYVRQQLTKYNPATSLVIVASKSFTTTETLANGQVAKDWLLSAAPNPDAAARQLYAVTAKQDRAQQWGISAEQILPVWEWVGGRYSVWSAMSLIVAIAIGSERFQEFLAGAELMDIHFGSAEFRQNMPVILGLLDVWYNNFFIIPHRAIIPYGLKLRYFPNHLQQVYMESLGKRVDQEGRPVEWETGFVIWGGAGSNSQHSFHQLLLQGTQWPPIDFILPLDNLPLVANCLAQSQLLMTGHSDPSQQKVIIGNRPSHLLLIRAVTPKALGTLLAMHEHRVYVNSVIWGINAFDQWGVERGKVIANQILQDLTTGSKHSYDGSTAGLLKEIAKK